MKTSEAQREMTSGNADRVSFLLSITARFLSILVYQCSLALLPSLPHYFLRLRVPALVGNVSIETMHYVECKDVLALQLPPTIKQSLQAHEREKEQELRKLQQRAEEDVKKKRRMQHRKSMVFW